MVAGREVPKAIVAHTTEGAELALERMLTSTVQRLFTHDAVCVTVVAASTLGTHRQKEPVTQSSDEVRIRKTRRLVPVHEERRLQEAPSAFAAMGAEVHTVILGEARQEAMPRASPEELRPGGLLLGVGTRQERHPVRTAEGSPAGLTEPGLSRVQGGDHSGALGPEALPGRHREALRHRGKGQGPAAKESGLRRVASRSEAQAAVSQAEEDDSALVSGKRQPQ